MGEQFYSKIVQDLENEKSKFMEAIESGKRKLDEKGEITRDDLPYSYDISAGTFDEDAHNVLTDGIYGEIGLDMDGAEDFIEKYIDTNDGLLGSFLNISNNPYLDEQSGMIEEFMQENDLHYISETDGQEYGIDYDVISDMLSDRYVLFCEDHGYKQIFDCSFCFSNTHSAPALSREIYYDINSAVDAEQNVDIAHKLINAACSDSVDDDYDIDDYRRDLEEWAQCAEGLYDEVIDVMETLSNASEGLLAFGEPSNIESEIKSIVLELCE